MSADSQREEKARQLRQQAEELELRAQRADDPEEHRRLIEEAVRIRAKCQETGGPESATMDPM
ncbi:DUF6381 family protein [Streptomyces sp. NPDC047014]|uniref:DUF6381 family protein n=1 Tax=Streptomyces sp. NPDC047014 TaxID=3155736 RepID=UPI0033E1101F